MNSSESKNTFVPRQAIAPTPELYDELVADGMENLAKATLAQFPPITSGAVVHDNGCGTGAGTSALMALLSDRADKLSIKGTDINEQALAVYREQAAKKAWPAEGIHMDSAALSFPDDTFTHSIGNALLFVLPDDGAGALRETYRTLRPGGLAAVNSWAYVPNMEPVRAASRATRPGGTPVPRQGLDRWARTEHLRGLVRESGFEKDKIREVQADVHVTTSEVTRYAAMLWSFIGGTGPTGWLESDEENWDRAVEIVKEQLRKTEGYKEIDGGKLQLKFIANIVIAMK
ncbi:S-adenosyl-L-methionine-dependent methyltransferase [Coniochaeta ligniaria NRRL 30616]|uniref:S-adenosyl-L-methionine-dependent methyltransferase n=1 Tax=Coniochaeta ligniaria NRRL 30616 TaxID=1408157 RepID=A0A1J7IGM2_9PEZI|nr:S-adenosyl-L-methionine-dependent methyltransferase [Coniochaeta ligniaria NRRL 30616]